MNFFLSNSVCEEFIPGTTENRFIVLCKLAVLEIPGKMKYSLYNTLKDISNKINPFDLQIYIYIYIFIQTNYACVAFLELKSQKTLKSFEEIKPAHLKSFKNLKLCSFSLFIYTLKILLIIANAVGPLVILFAE